MGKSAYAGFLAADGTTEPIPFDRDSRRKISGLRRTLARLRQAGLIERRAKENVTIAFVPCAQRHGFLPGR
jgi:hypothetical protein